MNFTRHIMLLLLAAVSTLLPIRGLAQEASSPSLLAADTASTPTTYNFPDPPDTRVVEDPQEVQRILKTHGSDLLVVNFWATWCAPCVEELPYFVDLANYYPEENVRVLGFLTDFPDQIDTLVVPFLKQRKIPYSNIVMFADPNVVIDFFAREWGGEIPTTFFFDRAGNKRAQFLRPLSRDELFAKTEEVLKEIQAEKQLLLEAE